MHGYARHTVSPASSMHARSWTDRAWVIAVDPPFALRVAPEGAAPAYDWIFVNAWAEWQVDPLDLDTHDAGVDEAPVAHLVVHKDRRFSAAVEVFQRDWLSGLADQARTKVSTA
jgi:hypothetical protein